MSSDPTKEVLEQALAAAGKAHHDYETNILGGVRDEQWPGWYAAYVLGRLGDFTSPSQLSEGWWRRRMVTTGPPRPRPTYKTN